jgi:serine/threonine protein kinase
MATTRKGTGEAGENGGDTYNCLLDEVLRGAFGLLPFALPDDPVRVVPLDPFAAISRRWASVRSAIQLRAVGVVLPQPIQFGKYTLFERIGRGGMADVFKSRVQGPAGFERIFVVKRILPHLSDDPTFTKMFIEEAKMSARLSHPNIVQVFELGAVEQEYFISMEYVRGRDLAETMRTLWARIGPPRPELVAYVGREMCRALAYAHDVTADDGTPLGMIHRDVSPSNVMLSYDGAVKLLDFGIAKALGGEEQPEETGTQRGTLKGKFAYMAPEQTQGVDVDRRIDIFATGIVLHEILTGRRLFKGENDLQTVEKVRVCDVPPPSLQNPLCPPELDVIVLKALAKYRDDRFQSASEMADALDDVVHAARFQPSHLAQLMRDLFPAEAGGGDARNTSSSARITQSLTGSSSRPYSPAMRSPTIPPISRSVSTVRGLQAREGSAIAPPRVRPFYKRSSVWGVAGLMALGFVGGAVWMQSSAPVSNQVSGPKPDKPRALQLELNIQSIPDGAEVYVLGTNEYLGKTSFHHKFDWREDKPTILVFKLKGYEEITRDVKPTWTGLVHMKPASPALKNRPGSRGEDRDKEKTNPPPPTPTPAPAAAPAEPAKEAPKDTTPKEAPKPAEATPPGGGMPAPTATVPPPTPAGEPARPANRPTDPAHDTHRRPATPRTPKKSDLVDPF